MALREGSPDASRILVTGGTGTLGRLLVQRLLNCGYRVRVLSRRPKPFGLAVSPAEWAIGNLATGEGLVEAVDGCRVIVHLATGIGRIGPTFEWVDVAGTERLLEWATEAHVEHVLYSSIVGIDRIPFGYYRAKLEGEQLIRASGLPWTILRATQFHSLIDSALSAQARLPVLVLPPADIPLQPVDPADVAEQIEAAIATGPSGHRPDFGGPEVVRVDELAATWQRERDGSRPVIHLPLRGRAIAAIRAGHLTVGAESTGLVTFDEWLRSGRARELTIGNEPRSLYPPELPIGRGARA